MPRWRYDLEWSLTFHFLFQILISKSDSLLPFRTYLVKNIYIYSCFWFPASNTFFRIALQKKNSNSQIHKNRNYFNSSTQSIHWPAINFNKIPLDPLDNVLLNTPRPLVSTRWCDNVRNNISIYPLDVGEAASIRISIAAPDVIALHRGEISSFGTRNLGRKRTSFVRTPDRGDPPRAKEGSEIRLENRPARV